ncbi:MAG: hemolysin III family protein [Rubrivivax sp.]|nr:hemolysin III family protein [Rubrivivax sp.]
MPPDPLPLREERANAWSHGLGFVAAAGALPLLAAAGWQPRAPEAWVGAGVFAASMALVFLASTLYHALPRGRARFWLHRADHAAIFLSIAGSFTPFALHGLGSTRGLLAFVAVWLLALAGMAFKARGRLRCPRLSTLLYVALGWTAAAAALPTLEVLGPRELELVAAGGAAYMVGALFFLADRRLRYGHFVWHLFVLVGCACHFAAAAQHLA